MLNVFHGGICHPKMALVIDDRLKVWDDKDQSRVHVVPPFVPYYAPQAEVYLELIDAQKQHGFSSKYVRTFLTCFHKVASCFDFPLCR